MNIDDEIPDKGRYRLTLQHGETPSEQCPDVILLRMDRRAAMYYVLHILNAIDQAGAGAISLYAVGSLQPDPAAPLNVPRGPG